MSLTQYSAIVDGRCFKHLPSRIARIVAGLKTREFVFCHLSSTGSKIEDLVLNRPFISYIR